MASRVEWSREFEELKQALRVMPEHLAKEASNDVLGAANAMAVEVRTKYGRHRRVGNLQEGVEVRELKTKGEAVGYEVRNKAPHAYIFEHGTEARHHASGQPTGTMWGRTPPPHIFIPAAIKHRRQQYEEHKQMLVREGFVVSGDAR
jgi:hypothetical protein